MIVLKRGVLFEVIGKLFDNCLPAKTESRSLINSINKIGPWTEPLRTPLSIGDGAERQCSTDTCCERFARKATFHEIKSGGILIAESLWSNFV